LALPASKTLQLDEPTRKSIFNDILRATVSLEFATRLQQGIFNNFAVEVLHIQPAQLGLVQGLRELPGLLSAPMAFFSQYFAENVWAAISILLTGVGLVLYAFTGTFPMLILATLVFSTGFHLFYPVQSSIVMKSQLPEERATKLGLLNSGAAVGSLVAFFLVLVLSKYVPRVNYSFMHLMAAAAAGIGGFLVLSRKIPSSGSGAKAVEFNPRYMSYYVLTLLSGGRRHITMTFAGFLLVQTFHTPVGTMVLLSAVSSLVAIFTRPWIGKLIDRWGEQKSLILNYGIIVPIFLAYGFLKLPLLLYIAYIVDNGSIGFDVAISTHLGKIAPKESLSSAFSMGQTINHISGVSVPMVGGYVWDLVGSRTVFVAGSVLALVSLWYSSRLDSVERSLKPLA
jgi:MFS family permease